ncbi:hypothetical protein ACHQM5_020556 [Ranunculus cassubicifolius]
MDMEVVGETMGSNNSSDQLLIVKGRRTKRQRPSSPFSVATSSGDRSSSSVESTDEEEDMANCLILLAQGNNNHKNDQRKQQQQQRVSDQKIQESGLYVYQCKTCERCFSSFQALGGHRASHKKPKTEQHEDKKALVLFHEEDGVSHHHHQQSLVHQKAHNNKSKVHECSICGSEFSSGQALGGHMRRHRTTPPPSTATAMVNMNQHRFTSESPQEIKKPTTFLALDLNLPAPEEEGPASNKYSFSSSLVFSASPMVDCHY